MAETQIKTDAVFTLPNSTKHNAVVHLFVNEYKMHRFWYGVAQFEEVVDLPSTLAGGRCDFPDGRFGGVSFMTGHATSEGYFEVGFIGLSTLQKAG